MGVEPADLVVFLGLTEIEIEAPTSNVQLTLSGTTVVVPPGILSTGTLEISGTTTSYRVYAEYSTGVLAVDSTTSTTATNIEFSNTTVELNGSSFVQTNFFDSNGELEISGSSTVVVGASLKPHGAQDTRQRRKNRQVAYLSYVRLGFGITSEITFHPAAPPAETSAEDTPTPTKPKRPLGELGRFLQNFKKTGVTYSFDSISNTALFRVDSDVELDNPLQRRVREQQLEAEDALLLGIPNLAEDELAMYSSRTNELWSIVETQQTQAKLREQEDLDLLGISDSEINILS